MALLEKITEPNFWELHVAQWQASGLSQVKCCEQHGLRVHQPIKIISTKRYNLYRPN